MAPCDPYSDPVRPKTPQSMLTSIDARLAAMLAFEESSVNESASSLSTSHILQLPKELFVLTLSFITSKHDLSQLCLVSRRTYAVALPSLYREIHVTLNKVLSPRLVQMLAPENTGPRYVRKVTVSTDKNINIKPQNIHQWLYLLINRIQTNILEDFRWEVPHPLPLQILSVLWQRQKKLRRLEIFAPFKRDSSADDESMSELKLFSHLEQADLPNLVEVRIVPNRPGIAFIACSALQRDNVTCLEVDARLWDGGHPRIIEDDGDENDDGRTVKVEDKLTELLFSHVKPVKPGYIANCATLTDLRLKDLDLTLCRFTWFTYLELSQLKHLRLEHCKGADIFLMKMTSGAATPGLQSFTLIHDLGRYADRTIHAIEELLTSPRNKVKHLELCLRNAKELPKAASIRAHGRSLETLLLDVQGSEANRGAETAGWATPPTPPSPIRSRPGGALAYEDIDFQDIIESCSSLIELGIAMFPDQVNLEYKSFDGNSMRDFPAAIYLLARRLHKLTTLNILNWPVGYCCGPSEGFRKAKNAQLVRLATDIFRHHRSENQKIWAPGREKSRAPLEVVAFGVRENSTGSSPPPVYFVQSEVSVVGKKPMISAHEVELKYLRDQNYDREILGYEPRDFDGQSRATFGERNARDNPHPHHMNGLALPVAPW